MSINNQWNENIENLLHDIRMKSSMYKCIHIKKSQKLKKIYNILMISGIIIGPFSSLSTGIEFLTDNQTLRFILLISVVLNMTSSIHRMDRA